MDKYKKDSVKKSDISKGSLKITLKTLFGLEEVLKEELEELGYSDVKILNRAVQIDGTWKDIYFLNLHTRCAISILVEIAQFRIKHEDDLYAKSMKIDWTEYFDISKTCQTSMILETNMTFFSNTIIWKIFPFTNILSTQPVFRPKLIFNHFHSI